MGKQEPMTAQEQGELRGNPAPPPAGRAPGLPGWFRRLSRARRLAITSSAAVIAVAVALLALGATSASPAKPAPLRAAPGFSLAALDHAGQSISLASYAGRPLV